MLGCLSDFRPLGAHNGVKINFGENYFDPSENSGNFFFKYEGPSEMVLYYQGVTNSKHQMPSKTFKLFIVIILQSFRHFVDLNPNKINT